MNQVTGKNLEQILSSYAKEHQVEQSELIYHVIDEKAGFLGFGASVTLEIFSLRDVESFVHDYLDRFFKGLSLDVSVEVSVKSNAVNVNLSADNNAIIIGRNGSSLEGLNLVLRHAVNAQFKRRFNCFVDVNNYKKERYAKLIAMAQRIAKSVQRTKIDVALDPMPNDERRTIHKELTEFPNIRTVSEGSGRNRHLKIVYDPNKE